MRPRRSGSRRSDPAPSAWRCSRPPGAARGRPAHRGTASADGRRRHTQHAARPAAALHLAERSPRPRALRRIAEAVSSAPPPLQPGAARGGGPADELDRLYPDSFQDSELGPIPAGWRVGCVDDEFDVTIGQSPPGHTYNEVGDGLPFCQGRSDFGFRFPNRRVFCTAALRIAKTGDTLISLRAPVGDVNMAAEECAIGRGVAARPKTGSRSHSYQFMRAQADVFACFEAEGTVFG